MILEYTYWYRIGFNTKKASNTLGYTIFRLLSFVAKNRYIYATTEERLRAMKEKKELEIGHAQQADSMEEEVPEDAQGMNMTM